MSSNTDNSPFLQKDSTINSKEKKTDKASTRQDGAMGSPGKPNKWKKDADREKVHMPTISQKKQTKPDVSLYFQSQLNALRETQTTKASDLRGLKNVNATMSPKNKQKPEKKFDKIKSKTNIYLKELEGNGAYNNAIRREGKKFAQRERSLQNRPEKDRYELDVVLRMQEELFAKQNQPYMDQIEATAQKLSTFRLDSNKIKMHGSLEYMKAVHKKQEEHFATRQSNGNKNKKKKKSIKRSSQVTGSDGPSIKGKATLENSMNNFDLERSSHRQLNSDTRAPHEYDQQLYDQLNTNITLPQLGKGKTSRQNNLSQHLDSGYERNENYFVHKPINQSKTSKPSKLSKGFGGKSASLTNEVRSELTFLNDHDMEKDSRLMVIDFAHQHKKQQELASIKDGQSKLKTLQIQTGGQISKASSMNSLKEIKNDLVDGKSELTTRGLKTLSKNNQINNQLIQNSNQEQNNMEQQLPSNLSNYTYQKIAQQYPSNSAHRRVMRQQSIKSNQNRLTQQHQQDQSQILDHDISGRGVNNSNMIEIKKNSIKFPDLFDKSKANDKEMDKRPSFQQQIASRKDIKIYQQKGPAINDLSQKMNSQMRDPNRQQKKQNPLRQSVEKNLFDQANYKPVLAAQKTNSMFYSQHSSHMDTRTTSPFNQTASRLTSNALESQTEMMKIEQKSRDIDSKLYVKIDLGEDRSSFHQANVPHKESNSVKQLSRGTGQRSRLTNNSREGQKGAQKEQRKIPRMNIQGDEDIYQSREKLTIRKSINNSKTAQNRKVLKSTYSSQREGNPDTQDGDIEFSNTLNHRAGQQPIEWNTLNNINVQSMETLNQARVSQVNGTPDHLDGGQIEKKRFEIPITDSLAQIVNNEVIETVKIQEQIDPALYSKQRSSFDNFQKTNQNQQQTNHMNLRKDNRNISREFKKQREDSSMSNQNMSQFRIGGKSSKMSGYSGGGVIQKAINGSHERSFDPMSIYRGKSQTKNYVNQQHQMHQGNQKQQRLNKDNSQKKLRSLISNYQPTTTTLVNQNKDMAHMYDQIRTNSRQRAHNTVIKEIRQSEMSHHEQRNKSMNHQHLNGFSNQQRKENEYPNQQVDLERDQELRNIESQIKDATKQMLNQNKTQNKSKNVEVPSPMLSRSRINFVNDDKGTQNSFLSKTFIERNSTDSTHKDSIGVRKMEMPLYQQPKDLVSKRATNKFVASVAMKNNRTSTNVHSVDQIEQTKYLDTEMAQAQLREKAQNKFIGNGSNYKRHESSEENLRLPQKSKITKRNSNKSVNKTDETGGTPANKSIEMGRQSRLHEQTPTKIEKKKKNLKDESFNMKSMGNNQSSTQRQTERMMAIMKSNSLGQFDPIQNKKGGQKNQNKQESKDTPAFKNEQQTGTQNGTPNKSSSVEKHYFGNRNSPNKKSVFQKGRQSDPQILQITQQQSSAEKRFKIEDFQMIKILGRGNFGQVVLVRHMQSKELYALKILLKERIRGSKHIQHIKNEKDIMGALCLQQISSSNTGRIRDKQNQVTSFFVKFHESFQDDTKLYLMLEYLPGGELLKQIKQKMSISLQDSVFYLAEILMAIKQLHDRNIIYRDLKPENILLDSKGHIRLIDFGFAKQLKSINKDRAKTNCGTPAYAAPEVLVGTGYSYKADIWSFGILICEILGGFTPFGHKGIDNLSAQDRLDAGMSTIPPHQIIELANSGRIPLPKNLNQVTRDLVKRILIADPNMRMEIRDMMKHKFFADVDWDSVSAQILDPPYVPSEKDMKEFVNQNNSDDFRDLDSASSPLNGHPMEMVPEETKVGDFNTMSRVMRKMQKMQGNSSAHLESDGVPRPDANSSDIAQTSTSTTLNKMEPTFGMNKPRTKIGSNISSKSSPQYQQSLKRTMPNKILGDFHLNKMNKVFENF